MEISSSPRIFNRLLYNRLATLAVNFGFKDIDQAYWLEDSTPTDQFHPETIGRFAHNSEDVQGITMHIIDYRVPHYDNALTRVQLFGRVTYQQQPQQFRSRFTFAFSVCESDTEGLILVQEQSIAPGVHGQRLIFPEDEGAVLLRALERRSRELYLLD